MEADARLARARAAGGRAPREDEAQGQADARADRGAEGREGRAAAGRGRSSPPRRADARSCSTASRLRPTQARRTAFTDDDAVELRRVGEQPSFSFEPRDHLELARIDTERGAKVSGSRFVYRVGAAALLELALYRFALDRLDAKGFAHGPPPVLVREDAMYGTGFLPTDEVNIYRVERDELYLTGTSEVALAALHAGEILDADALPLRYAGLFDVLPPRGRRRREGHARHVPRPSVRQGRDVRLHASGELGRHARPPARHRGGARRRSSGSPTASSTSPPATSAPRPRRSTTSRRGSRARRATGRSPPPRTRPTTSRGAWTFASAASRASSSCTRSTERP